MYNNLCNIEKSLRSISKRYKTIKYSLGLAILFLMLGVNAFSEEVMTSEEIIISRENLKNSVGSLQSKINEAKAENERELKGLRLELVQLKEQGDQIVKSPWSPWQFGANYMYSKWNGTYKGKGDKTEKYPFEGMFTRSTNLFERAVSPLSEKYKDLAISTNSNSALTNRRNGINPGYGLTNIKQTQEPIVTIEINAAVKPKNIQKNAISLNVPQVIVPTLPTINVVQKTPPSIELPEPKTPNKVVTIAKPNAEHFTGYYFDGTWSHRELKNNIAIYSGIDPASIIGNLNNINPTPAAMNGSYNGREFQSTLIRNENDRYTNTYYIKDQPDADKVTDDTFYLRGHYTTDTYDDSNTRAHKGVSNNGHIAYNDGYGNGIPDEGVVGIHALTDLKFKNLKFNLYGRAGAITNETWRHGILDLENVTVNMYNSDNMGFYNMPVARYTYKYARTGKEWRTSVGGFSGKVNVNMYGRNNSVYLTTGLSYMKHWENEGNIQSDGASNIVYSSFSYAPTLSKIVDKSSTDYSKYTNKIELKNVNLYGDENIGMYFGSRIKGNIAKVHMEGANELESVYGYNNKAAHIGVYQGEIDFTARIGEKLSINNGNKQTTEGNLINADYTDKTVDGAVGIFSESGQRVGIVAKGDIMEGEPPSYAEIQAHKNDPTWERWFLHTTWDDTLKKWNIDKTNYSAAFYYALQNDFSKDPIHNLEVAKLDIRFGKYSKNGIMILSKSGTVIDVGKNSSNLHVTGESKTITDGINGENTLEGNASTGTIIAYSEGTWDQLKHRYGSEDARIKKNDDDAKDINNGNKSRAAITDPNATTAAKLQGLPSEINVYPDVVLASKEGIAYMGDNKGIVNARGKTTAINHSSIIGYAKKEGKVTIYGEVIGQDRNTASDNNKYKNIAAFAESGGTVNIEGRVTINGIGAFAKGANSKAQLLSGNDVIEAGTVGGLVATDNGYVRFDGGTINVTKDNSRLFYADSTGKIDFTKDTTINISKGIMLPSEENDVSFYKKNNTGIGGTPTKYNGMKWVTIKLLTDDVVLKTVNNHVPETWNGSTNFENSIQNTMKYKKLEKNNHTYKVYYTNGEFKIAHSIDLDTKSDVFNSIIMGNEKVTINSGISIISNTGKGLVQAALPNTVNNGKTGYINNGIVNVGGGNSDSIGIRVNHGSIENNNLVRINNRIGLYGSNGSKILNNTAGKIEITSPTDYGIGIAGFLSGATAQNYGTDKTIASLIGTLPTSVKTIDITNNGKIEISGKAIGIYANNTSSIPNFDKHVTKDNAVVNNNASLSFENDSIGIFSKKATVNLRGTGTNDITVGERGIGVYAKDSSINFKSDYGFQIKDNGTGIYADDTDTSNGNMKLNYTGRVSSRGIGIYFTGTSAMTNRLNLDVENISGSTKGIIGIYASAVPFTNEGNIKIKNTNTLGFGIISDNSNITNKGNIILEDSLDSKNPNIAVYMTGANTLKNLGNIKVGKNSIGVYTRDFINGDSFNPNSTIEVGENGIGVYSIGGNGNLEAGNIKVGKDGIGIYAAGNGGTIHAKQSFTMTLGNGSDGDNKGSFGFVNVGTNNKIISDITNITLQNNSIYIYSKDKSGTSSAPQIKNNTNITATGKNNYGIYSAGYGINTGNMNLQAGTGNVGMYSVKGGTIENRKRADGTGGVITVGGSVLERDEYGIGMAAGYSWTKKDLEKPISQRPEQTTGNIINRGTININGEYSIGMYGSGDGTTIENHGNINLNASNTTGIYLNDRAVGHNYGTIINSAGVKDITAVVVRNGAKLINEPTGIIRLNAENAIGAFKTADNKDISLGVFENYGIFEINGDNSEKEKTATTHDLNKSVGNGKNKTSIDVPAGSPVGTIKVGGKIKTPEIIDTNKNIFEKTQVSSIGMYINTSGDRFTRPITGLSALKSLRKADLIIGVEAAKNTNSKYIQIGQNILEPYNKTIRANPQIKKWNIYSASLTWMANIAQKDSDGTIENAYLAKIPYPIFAKNKDTYNFTDGLEQRYGVEALGSRENQLFQKLNGIGSNEEVLLYQAFDEMMGHQYANVQQRVQTTGIILDKEFNYLRDEWQNVSKDSNKIKTFGTRGEYKTNTAGVIDYKYNAYGVAYVHENEDIKLGRGVGWYTGIVHNTFKFKDIGKSKEEQLQGKVGLLKSVPFDHNNSLNWTITGDIFVGYNKMHRKYLVVDDIFNAKARYYTYGIGVKNQLTKSFRLSEDFSLSPYVALNLEYGRVSKIKEKNGEMKLEVKSNDYLSVKPEVGTQLTYRHYFGTKTLRTTIGVAYENELGKVANGKNKAKVANTNADWFNIRGEKEDRRGNVKFDLNVGLDNQRYGVTANAGYDTKGHNIRGGLGLRVIF